MSQGHNHLNHATWECKYHVVFTPKYRKKLLFGQIRRHLGSVFRELDPDCAECGTQGRVTALHGHHPKVHQGLRVLEQAGHLAAHVHRGQVCSHGLL
jgi:hypothetical protein